MQENVQKDNIAEIKMDAKNRLEHVEKKLSHNRITICFFLCGYCRVYCFNGMFYSG